MQVLVLEDNLFFVTRLESKLRELGHIPLLASTLSKACKLLAGKPDGVVVDLHAPGALEMIGLAKDTGIPVIAFSGHLEVEIRRQAKAAGADVLLANSEILSALDLVLTRINLSVPPSEEDFEPAPS